MIDDFEDAEELKEILPSKNEISPLKNNLSPLIKVSFFIHQFDILFLIKKHY